MHSVATNNTVSIILGLMILQPKKQQANLLENICLIIFLEIMI